MASAKTERRGAGLGEAGAPSRFWIAACVGDAVDAQLRRVDQRQQPAAVAERSRLQPRAVVMLALRFQDTHPRSAHDSSGRLPFCSRHPIA
jgi:hypothetical protein